MNFGQAIEALKKGLRVSRVGWNGKGMWLVLVDTWLAWPTNDGTKSKEYLDSTPAPFIAMKTAQNTFIPWLASQADMLAEDWELVE